MKKRIMVLALAMLLALSMTAGPVFAGADSGKKDDRGKDKVVCLVKHKAGKSGKHVVIKVPKHAAKKHAEKHGDKIIKCFKVDKDKKDKKGKDDKDKPKDKPKKDDKGKKGKK